jgi:hypothetical protein
MVVFSPVVVANEGDSKKQNGGVKGFAFTTIAFRDLSLSLALPMITR